MPALAAAESAGPPGQPDVHAVANAVPSQNLIHASGNANSSAVTGVMMGDRTLRRIADEPAVSVVMDRRRGDEIQGDYDLT